jgi:hypothetical protein
MTDETAVISHPLPKTVWASLFDPTILRQAIGDSFKKLAPQYQWRNPVMFVVYPGESPHHGPVRPGPDGPRRGPGGVHPGGDPVALVHAIVRQLRRERRRGPGQGPGGLTAPGAPSGG